MISKEELHDMYWDQEMTAYEIARSIDVSYGTVYNRLKKHGIGIRTKSEAQLKGVHKSSKEELEQMYWGQGMSLPEIAMKIGVSSRAVGRWMKEHDIESRSGNWQGGISFEPYCNKFNDKFKEAVRERDDYTCQLCGYEQLLGGTRLSIHHIHYDKENCYPDVVALCRSCNSRVNSNRNYWEQYFEDQLLYRGLSNWRVN